MTARWKLDWPAVHVTDESRARVQARADVVCEADVVTIRIELAAEDDSNNVTER
jgi:hypothetical protein